MSAPSKIVLLHTMDPRGGKLGGIETHVRHLLAHHPQTISLLFVGIDEIGDLVLGQPVSLTYEGRQITFLPVAKVAGSAINIAAKKVWQSTTLRYAIGLVRYLLGIRAAIGGAPASCEIERFEFALLPKLLGIPLVLIVHNEGTRKDAMDSLLKKYWFLHRFNERLALTLAARVFAVNASIAEKIDRLSPALGRKTEVMSVSVDTRIFAAAPFDLDRDCLRICFAGRLDAFKDPPLMFATIARLREKLAARPAGRFQQVAFDYVGASDPTAVAQFAQIADCTIRHGIRTPAEVAAIMRRAHVGLITSFFEGMPCYLLEMLASGRPVAAVRLPQFEPVIVPGLSGCLVDRLPSLEDTANALADALRELACSIDAGRLDPAALAAQVSAYSVDAQLHRLFACHEELATGAPRPAPGREPVGSAVD